MTIWILVYENGDRAKTKSLTNNHPAYQSTINNPLIRIKIYLRNFLNLKILNIINNWKIIIEFDRYLEHSGIFWHQP